MAQRPSLRRRQKPYRSTDLNLTPFIDILICLVLFLLVTAMFGKSSILNLYLPTESDGSAEQAVSEPKTVPTVAVTKKGFLLSRGKGRLEEIPLKNEEHDFAKLQEQLLEMRKDPSFSDSIILLPETRLRYQILITTMDTCREFLAQDGSRQPLFPVISLGEFQDVASAAPAKGT